LLWEKTFTKIHKYIVLNNADATKLSHWVLAGSRETRQAFVLLEFLGEKIYINIDKGRKYTKY
jgi:hypothetical protein